MLSADIISFQFYEYARNFFEAIKIGERGESSHRPGGKVVVEFNGRDIHVLVNHTNLCYHEEINRFYYERRKIEARAATISQMYTGRRIITSVDKLDLLAGLSQKFQAFDRFLELHPKYRNRVALVQFCYSPDGKVNRELIHKLNAQVSAINHRWKNENKPLPHIYLRHGNIDRVERAAIHYATDVCLDTSVKDGLNMTMLHFLAVKSVQGPKSGQMVVSEFSGVQRVLPGAIKVNPWNSDQIAAAIAKALSPKDAHHMSFERDCNYVRNQSLAKWTMDFLMDLKRARKPDDKIYIPMGIGTNFRVLGVHADFRRIDSTEVLRAYKRSVNRIIILDNEGTLASAAAQRIESQPAAENNVQSGHYFQQIPEADHGEEACFRAFRPDPQAVHNNTESTNGVYSASSNEALQARGSPPTLEVLGYLADIVSDPSNTVIIVSGREKKLLQEWFKTAHPTQEAVEEQRAIQQRLKKKSSSGINADGDYVVYQKSYDSDCDEDYTPSHSSTADMTVPTSTYSRSSVGDNLKPGDEGYRYRVKPSEEPDDSLKNLGIAAEHGFYYRVPKLGVCKWQSTCGTICGDSAASADSSANGNVDGRPKSDQDPQTKIWKDMAKYIMNKYVLQTCGSFIEEKEAAVVWQYRDNYVTGHQFRSQLASELESVIPHRFPVDITAGKGYVEVKRKECNKGLAVKRFIRECIAKKGKPDFILCVGDDRTDESMFEVVNNHTYEPPQSSSCQSGDASASSANKNDAATKCGSNSNKNDSVVQTTDTGGSNSNSGSGNNNNDDRGSFSSSVQLSSERAQFCGGGSQSPPTSTSARRGGGGGGDHLGAAANNRDRPMLPFISPCSKTTTAPNTPEFAAKNSSKSFNFNLTKLSAATMVASSPVASTNSQSMVPLQRYFSVTVGSKVSKAKFYVENTEGLTSILQDLAKCSRGPSSAQANQVYNKEDDWVRGSPTPTKGQQAFFHSFSQ